MAENAARGRRVEESASAWILGAMIYAAILLMLAGIFQVFAGLAAILNDDFLPPVQHYFSFDATAWGWLHLSIGVVVAVAGFNLFEGRMWTRLVGIGVALLSAVDNFLLVPYHAVWSVIIIALDMVVIWALCSSGLEADH